MSNARFPYLSAEEVANFPSIKTGIDPEKELTYRQQASAFIQELGQRLQCTQCTMNTAIVYMHRFYSLNSFAKFHRNAMAPACLFLACKVEEQPRKVEHIIKAVYRIICRDKQPPEPNTEEYLQKAEELVVNENILLQTLGFRIIVDHPHPHLVRYCDRELANTLQGHNIAQVAWFLATNSLHLTTFCLQYPPTIIAALCIYLSSKYISYPLQSKSNQPWWFEIDQNASEELFTKLAFDFVAIMDKAPTKYKTHKGSKIGSESLLGQSGSSQPNVAAANEDSRSSAQGQEHEIVKQDAATSKEESKEDKAKTGKGTCSAANTDDDDLASPPRKQSKLGTAISLKDYKARKATLPGGQACDSPTSEHRVSVKASPAAIPASGEQLSKTTNSSVPASLRDLPPLEPLTLSMEQESASDKDKIQDSQKVHQSHNGKDRHRSHHHHHHHHNHSSHHKSSEEAVKSDSKPGSQNADRHHRHHLPRHHSRPSGTGAHHDNAHRHHHSHKSSSQRTSESEQQIVSNTSISNNDTNTGDVTLSTKSEQPIMEVSMKIPIDGHMLDACQTLLATPPSPTSAQHHDLMDVVKTEQPSDKSGSVSDGQAVV